MARRPVRRARRARRARSGSGAGCSTAQGRPVPDALIETWQADPDGRFAHPADDGGAGTTFRGFGRCPTDADGRCAILTLKPGSVADARRAAAPRRRTSTSSVFSRGPAQAGCARRIYFADEAAANEADAVLAGDRRPAARATLSPRPSRTATCSTSASRATARPSSSMSERLAGLFTRSWPAAAARDGGDDARLAGRAARDRGGARAGRGRAGVVAPDETPRRSRRACQPGRRSTPPRSGGAAVASGNPVVPLVEALRAAVGEPGGVDAVHLGATSQDILDTAAMLVAGRAIDAIVGGPRRGRRAAAPARGRAPPQPDGRADADAAGRADDLRRQGRGLAGRPRRGCDRAGASAPRAAGRPARRRRRGRWRHSASPDPRSSAGAGADPRPRPSRSCPWHAERSRIADLAGALGHGGRLGLEAGARHRAARPDRGRARSPTTGRDGRLVRDAAQAEPGRGDHGSRVRRSRSRASWRPCWPQPAAASTSGPPGPGRRSGCRSRRCSCARSARRPAWLRDALEHLAGGRRPDAANGSGSRRALAGRARRRRAGPVARARRR